MSRNDVIILKKAVEVLLHEWQSVFICIDHVGGVTNGVFRKVSAGAM